MEDEIWITNLVIMYKVLLAIALCVLLIACFGLFVYLDKRVK